MEQNSVNFFVIEQQNWGSCGNLRIILKIYHSMRWVAKINNTFFLNVRFVFIHSYVYSFILLVKVSNVTHLSTSQKMTTKMYLHICYQLNWLYFFEAESVRFIAILISISLQPRFAIVVALVKADNSLTLIKIIIAQ